MKILVLGTSDSDGSTLERRELAWPWLVGSRLGAEVVHKRYYATAPGALAYLERTLEQEDPDIVVVSVTLYAFSVRTVANRVRRVVGTRAGEWVEARVRWFDAATAGGGRGGRGVASRRLNRAAHWSARKLVGTASEASARDVWRAYELAVERLAREEERRVVVIGSMPFTAIIEKENAKARAVQLAFNRRLERLCASRRLGWVEPERFRRADPDEGYADALHYGEEAHIELAEAVCRAVEG